MANLEGKKKISSLRFGRKQILLVLAFICVGFVMWGLDRKGTFETQIIFEFLDDRPLYGVLLFIALYSASVVVLLPTLPLNLLGGYVWGVWAGGFYVAIAVTLGSLISFLLARSVFGKWLSQKFKSHSFGNFEETFNRHGWKYVAFVRLNPIFPTGPVNYLFGFTAIRSHVFLISSFVFLLPPSMAIAYLGETFQTFVSGDEDITVWLYRLMVVSFLITLLAAVILGSRVFLLRRDRQ
tara:strand:- start:2571 stop:3284 length:714 start_codon:yes stop_codon:yes gene_type:complete